MSQKNTSINALNILFVSSGNSKNGISSLTKNQGISLEKLGHTVTYYTIKGKGFTGYFKNIFKLRSFLKDRKFDIIHAHYSLSAMVAALAGAQPLIVSLMGSDVKAKNALRTIIKIFDQLFWKTLIVKSNDMKKELEIPDVQVIPNGVNFNMFKPIPREKALEVTGWNPQYKHILFAANPHRPEKNFDLAKNAFDLMESADGELHVLDNVPSEHMPFYFNASDVILLTSLYEGSPNVIKEAMACNAKIVTVDVGDVRKVVSSTEGCYITSFEAKEIANKLSEALTKPLKTNGRKNIGYLDDTQIAHQLTEVYKTVFMKSSGSNINYESL